MANALCTTTCTYSSDGDCDDGGSGAEYSLCAVGTDCTDCGPRTPAPPVPTASPPVPPMPPTTPLAELKALTFNGSSYYLNNVAVGSTTHLSFSFVGPPEVFYVGAPAPPAPEPYTWQDGPTVGLSIALLILIVLGAAGWQHFAVAKRRWARQHASPLLSLPPPSGQPVSVQADAMASAATAEPLGIRAEPAPDSLMPYADTRDALADLAAELPPWDVLFVDDQVEMSRTENVSIPTSMRLPPVQEHDGVSAEMESAV